MDQKKKVLKQSAQLIALGFELALPVVIGILAGYYLDRTLNSQPWLMLCGLAAGFFCGLRILFTLLKRFE